MFPPFKVLISLSLIFAFHIGRAQTGATYNEPYRPQIHFSPAAHWMNDPNGMVYYKGTYHLFFQYYPKGTVWGPMHWGHATSADLVHWKQQPIALYPDSLGYIFSGSAVADVYNTSGFGRNGKTPLVAIFTSHDPIGEKAGRSDYQNQSIAFSLDDGKTWTKYKGNPVLKNPGIRDFRDPKVSWYEPDKKWIMTLATQDRVTFYSSKNLKSWNKESEFGKGTGAHGGVWECPDLFPLEIRGKKVWILLVSINPGGPNGGSATQYFTGQFDGKTFTPYQTDTRWIDYGPDDYAGVTWSNTGRRKIFLGWMSNWLYAEKVPTEKWRSAMTLPRELHLAEVNGKYLLVSLPVSELQHLQQPPISLKNINGQDYDLTKKTGKLNGPAQLKIHAGKATDFSIILSNNVNEKLIIGYDQQQGQYYIDRTQSGKSSFYEKFAGRFTAPRQSGNPTTDITLIIDNASVELFADQGQTIMTAVYFSTKPYSNIRIQSPGTWPIHALQFIKMKRIWQ